MNEIHIIPEELTPLHLVRLVESLDSINNKDLSQAIANALIELQRRPIFFAGTDNQPGGEQP